MYFICFTISFLWLRNFLHSNIKWFLICSFSSSHGHIGLSISPNLWRYDRSSPCPVTRVFRSFSGLTAGELPLQVNGGGVRLWNVGMYMCLQEQSMVGAELCSPKIAFYQVRWCVFAVLLLSDCDSLRAGRSGHRIPVEARFSASVQTGSETHPACYTMGTGSFPGVKRPGRGNDHPPHLAPRLNKE